MPMTCEDVEIVIEALAAGELPASQAVERHLETCTRCAAALAGARVVERELAGWPVAAAPPRFTEAVIARIHRERWRYEEHLDRAFNLTIAVGVIAVLAALLALLNLGMVAGALLNVAAAVRTIAQDSHAAPRPLVGVLMP